MGRTIPDSSIRFHTQNSPKGKQVGRSHSSGSPSFAEVTKDQQRAASVRLSAHAQERLRQQNITISQQDMSRITDATQRAEEKGARESLILLKDLALVVNIGNRTVVTAIDKSRQKERVFTNIDSTVIL